MYQFLETERLTIQPLTPGDFSFIYRLLNSEGWLRNIGNRNIKNEDDAKAYIQQKLDDEKYYCNTFKLKETKEAIGVVTFIYRDTYDHPDIGYAMLPQFEKKGYAYEAVKKYLDTVIAEGVTDKIIAITLSSNDKSIQLLKRLGLQLERSFVEKEEEMSLFVLNAENAHHKMD